MATKNTGGNTLKNFKAKESRLVRIIDKREKTGENKENVDTTFNNFHHMTTDGERVWSF